MDNEKVFCMRLAKIYDLLLNKAVRKGRTQEEVNTVICWLTGYTETGLNEQLASSVSYGDFFRDAPRLNPDRTRIKGSVCGVRVEEVADPLMREMRYLDKLIDELAKGKPLDKVLRKIGRAHV